MVRIQSTELSWDLLVQRQWRIIDDERVTGLEKYDCSLYLARTSWMEFCTRSLYAALTINGPSVTLGIVRISARILASTHARTHARTHACMHAPTQTPTHTHTQARDLTPS